MRSTLCRCFPSFRSSVTLFSARSYIPRNRSTFLIKPYSKSNVFARSLATQTNLGERATTIDQMKFYKSFQESKLLQAQKECLYELFLAPSYELAHAYLNILEDMSMLSVEQSQSELSRINIDKEYFESRAKESGKHYSEIESQIEEVNLSEKQMALVVPILLGQFIQLINQSNLPKHQIVELHISALRSRSNLYRNIYHAVGKNDIQEDLLQKAIKDLASWSELQEQHMEKQRWTCDPKLNAGFVLVEHCASLKDGPHKTEYLKQAEEYFQGALAIREEEIEAIYGLGKVLQLKGEFHDAAQKYTQATDLSNDYAPAILSRAECFLSLQYYAPAIADISDFLENHKKYFDIVGARRSEPIRHESVVSAACWIRGLSYFRLGEYEVATGDLSICIKLKQKEASIARHYRAKCSMKLKNWYQSIADNTAAIAINPELIGAFKDRATANEIVGRKEDAENDRRRFNVLMSKKAAQGELPKLEDD